jgi:hypothetical protein
VDQVIRGSTVPVLLIPVNVQNDVPLHKPSPSVGVCPP